MQRPPARANCRPAAAAAAAAADSQLLLRARKEALQGRDTRKNGHGLVDLWREASKPRKGGAIQAQPPGCKVDFEHLFSRWLQDRGLANLLRRNADHQGWAVYRYTADKPVVNSGPGWEQAFHGTWWYSVWLILKSGILLESSDRSLGHDFWEPGVYCTPSLDTGLWYARPQILFGDGVYYRIIFELRVDPKRRKRDRKRGGVQWVFPSAGVALHAIWIRSNAPPSNGEERLNSWEPSMEALPPGCEPCEAIQNPRTGPWPDVVDDFPFILADTSVPPWMMDPKKVSEAAQKAGTTNRGGLRPLAHAWPRMTPRISWTEEAKEWTSDCGHGASWGSAASTSACTEPPRVLLLPGPNQMRPRGSVAVLQQRRADENQRNEGKEDSGMLRHWKSCADIQDGTAARRPSVGFVGVTLAQPKTPGLVTLAQPRAAGVTLRPQLKPQKGIAELHHRQAAADWSISPGAGGLSSASKRPFSEAGGEQLAGPAFKRKLV